MEITTSMIKELREATAAGVLDCKKALEASGGDLEKAKAFLQEKGLATAAKKADREVKEGLIEAYVHAGGRVGALIELGCETDFVARLEGFKELAHDLAMQIVATNPLCLTPEDIPPDVLEKEKEIYRTQARDLGKPERVVERILEGKLQKYYQEVCLMKQSFIKDDDLTVQDLLTQMIAKLGENIVVRRFARFELGGEDGTNYQGHRN
ncbi:MAG: translation elongation factor Ts [Chloroflexi bacterium]|nr:translation elongation factor Ts [Chloroflexota bacterium]